jgi:hypothetical protein
MKTTEKIANASSMVEIQGYIFSDTFYKYCVQFAQEGNAFNRGKETQENWLNRLFARFGKEMKQEQIELFNLIPSRFKKSIMYKQMECKIFT